MTHYLYIKRKKIPLPKKNKIKNANNTHSVDDDVLLVPSVSVDVPTFQPSLQAVVFDRVRVVASSTTCDLDFQLF